MNISKTILSACLIASPFVAWYAGYNKGTVDTTHALQPKLEAKTSAIQDLSSEVHNLGNEIDGLRKVIDLKDDQLAKPVTVSASSLDFKRGTNVGKFKISAYAPYDDRNYINSDGNPNDTATGTTPKPGTFAVDPRVIPYGSHVTIIYPNGTIERGIAEDTGGAIKNNRIDVFRYTFDSAMDFGMREAIVIWNK